MKIHNSTLFFFKKMTWYLPSCKYSTWSSPNVQFQLNFIDIDYIDMASKEGVRLYILTLNIFKWKSHLRRLAATNVTSSIV